MKPETFILPWPNSDNDHHTPIPAKSRQGKRIATKVLTKKAREYRSLVMMLMGVRSNKRRWHCLLDISIDLYPPRKGCDTNNYWKSLGDALTHAGVWDDDVLIVSSHARRHDPVKKKDAFVSVTLTEVES